jgi:hypothetical protein
MLGHSSKLDLGLILRIYQNMSTARKKPGVNRAFNWAGWLQLLQQTVNLGERTVTGSGSQLKREAAGGFHAWLLFI